MTPAIKSFPKPTRLKLHGKDYQDLVRQVFTRDSWQCRRCGAKKKLTVHHIHRRAQLGSDEIGNLLTLCIFCHNEIEEHRLEIEVVDVVVRFTEGGEEEGGEEEGGANENSFYGND